jgi:hypothetical protein
MLTAAAVVVCALDLLGRSPHSTVPIRFLDTPPPGASRNVEAFIMRRPDTIYLITSSEAFRDAARGRGDPRSNDGCRKIASIIVHEEWHLRYGDDEEGAYLAQLTTLMRLNADSATLTTVRRSMDAVRASQRLRSKEPVGAVARLP